MTSEGIKNLVKQKTILKGKITRLQNFIEQFDESPDGDLLKIKFERLPDIQNSIYNVLEQLQLTCEDEDLCSTFSQEELEIENRLDLLKTKYQSMLKVYDSVDVSNNSSFKENDCTVSEKQKVVLKPIDIKKFSGEITEFPHFIEIFTSLIESRKDLTDTEKHFYLTSLLEGEAANLIKSVPVTGSNFQFSLKLLKERYFNRRLIATKHASCVLELNKVNQSPLELNQFINELKSSVTALKSICNENNKDSSTKEGCNVFEFICLQLLLKKMTPEIARMFEKYHSDKNENNFPTVNEFISFLEKRRQFLETTSIFAEQDTSNQKTFKQNETHKPFKKHAFHVSYEKFKDSCIKCKGDHGLFKCNVFMNLTPDQKKEFVFQNKLCVNCLKRNHVAKTCASKFTCRKCNSKHNTILHDSFKNVVNVAPESSNQSYCSLKTKSNVNVLLSTAQVYVSDPKGNRVQARVLLDSASMLNFCTKDFANKLGFKTVKNNICISGINNVHATSVESISIQIHSRHENFSINVQCQILPRVTSQLPNHSFETGDWQLSPGICYADETFNCSQDVDILIGSQYFLALLRPGQYRSAPNMPIFQNTVFGYIAAGPLPKDQGLVNNELPVCMFVDNNQLSNQLEKFWTTEEINTKPLSVEDEFCNKHFEETTYRDPEDGKFVVRLPRKQSHEKLGDSLQNALHRFELLERRLKKDPNLKELYIDFMQQYLKLDHMCVSDFDTPPGTESYFIPHFPVFNMKSPTTKLRVVFDASSSSLNHVSLNQTLCVGEVLQQDLFSIVLKFRTYVYCVTCDIAKMYRCVKIHSDDYNLQKIIWRESPSNELVCYALTTVTYGTASASYLATRCLQQVALENRDNYPSACEVISDSFYCDDGLFGASSVSELKQLKHDVTKLLQEYGFPLHKWNSNVTEVIHDSPSENFKDVPTDLELKEPAIVRALGLIWKNKEDVLCYIVDLKQKDIVYTKRTIVSIVASLFDSLGLLGPVLIRYKIFIQELWCSNVQWDEEIPAGLRSKWLILYNDLNSVSEIVIPRLVKIKGNIVNIQLHGFCDSSISAFGAAIYLRSVNELGQTEVHLACSKTRVSPVKQVSIAKLELNGAVLLSRLYKKVSSSLKIEETFLWSDSKVVLCWLSSQPNRWKTYVGNRVSEIQESTKGCLWQFVPSKDNAADILSRGCSPTVLKTSKIWWNGPNFLTENKQHWPAKQGNSSVPLVAKEEERKQKLVALNTVETFELSVRYSTLNKAVHVIAYCKRFIYNLKNPKNRNVSVLSTEELDDALNVLIKQSQSSYFADEIHDLTEKGSISRKSKVLSLNPFLDEYGFLHVGGRLKFSDLSETAKYPLLLHSKSHLARLLVEHEHKRLLHAGLQLVNSSLRQRYWILRAKVLIRSTLHKCLICFKLKARPQNPLLGQLPKQRVTMSYPFEICGVDYAGPFPIRFGRRQTRSKNVTTCKAYAAIFVCFSTKAIHIEIVSDLSTECFLAAFRRFIARRGTVRHIYSDNGKNFVGANRQLKELYEYVNSDATMKELHAFTSSQNIKWSFIPAYAPNFGGLWEAAVKSFKFHLRRVIGDSLLSFEELTTIAAQIEACLNSRPLYSLSSDPTDPIPLTPGHFLALRPLTALPHPNSTNSKLSLTARWKFLQKLVSDFWSKWSKDYLHSLSQRSKCTVHTKNIAVNDVVVMLDDALPPLMWKLGRICKVYPGTDNVVRVVDVKTPYGVVRRSCNKLVVLPVQDEN